MLDFLRSTLSVVGAIFLVILIAIFWTALERRRSSRRDDGPDEPQQRP